MTDMKRSLVEYLLNRRDYVRGYELSDALKVSTKTISRLVKQVNAQYGESVIESMRGRGYQLNVDRYLRYNRGHKQGDIDVSRLTSVERRDEIIKHLLMSAPHRYRLEDLWGKYCISDSAMATDLRSLRMLLDKFHLCLERTSGYVWVEGSEANIRKAITGLFSYDAGEDSGRFIQPNHRVQQRDAALVNHQLDLIEELIHAEIPYPYRVNIFTHLYIMIERYRVVGSLMDGESTPEMRKALDEHSKIADVCKIVIDNLNAYLNAKLPDVEIYYLYQYLTSSRIDDRQPEAGTTQMPQMVEDLTHYLIDTVTADPRYEGIDRSALFASLSQHMKPLLNRLQNNIKVNNNLLEQIRLEYPDLFEAVKSASEQSVERFGLNPIDDAEVGFITVYFAQAVENMRIPLDILLVCTTGLGTAQLLQAKIEKRFSGLHIVETVATRDLQGTLAMHPEVALVVSTVGLPESITVPTLVVSAMLTIEDQERLERKVDQIRRQGDNL
ncbi:transcriptional antiterminator [Bombiscardovia nodaiensis]|uniref:Transcriptional antiterminator n=1 Tax=Bombiscardovia nodaiensis TaxID=2932181 RepID=A0ABM8B5W3_9BIFI|nr:transcriptional antiterminator [Bombiscardovia nodaiensis]